MRGGTGPNAASMAGFGASSTHNLTCSAVGKQMRSPANEQQQKHGG
jgi:hypothetical protein